MFDIIIHNGKIVDGSGQKGHPADIGIENGRITEISPGLAAETQETIDANGWVVCPGFIDMHSHSDFTLLVHPEAESKIRQGVTTELVGNCGGSPAPVPEERFDAFMQYMVDLGGLYQKVLAPRDWKWRTLSQFYEALEKKGVAVNVAPLVGHSTLRSAVMGYESGPPSPDELQQMKRLLEIELGQGVFGMSTGLIYHPGAFADRDELAELAKLIRSYDGLYTTHIRSEGKYLHEAVDEALYVAEESGASVEISHMKCEAPANWGKASSALSRIDHSRKNGFQVDFDQYPYQAYQTGLLEILPANKISVTPRHPYTKALADSVFVADPAARKETVPIEGEVPSPFNLPAGCVFGTRCPYVRDVCRDTPPTLSQIAETEYVACHFPLND